MKKIFLCAICVMLICGMCSCSVLTTLMPEHSDAINNAGNHLQDVFDDGVNSLENLLNQNSINASGKIHDGDNINTITANKDSLVIVLSTDKLVKALASNSITATSLGKERENADIAHMQYVIEYQYGIRFKVNGTMSNATCNIATHEDTLNSFVEITLPIPEDTVSTTVYDLLQGGEIKVECALKHGTETSRSTSETYTVSTDANKAGVLRFVDNRS
jgi:hypothetical protein